MTETSDQEKIEEEVERFSIVDFFEDIPPNQSVHISDLSFFKNSARYPPKDIMRTPEIQLHCTHESCNGVRFFRCISGKEELLNEKKYKFFYVTYRCSNCRETIKIYSLAAKIDESGKPTGECYKFGEKPTYGPPTPARLIKLIGPDRDLFLKGRRCENQGLGIGAFIYYRRVVENQKDRILKEIIKVTRKIGASEEKIVLLNSAIDGTQFSKALDLAKDAIPESLLINGHSPLLLLYKALSEGVHNKTDEQCLEIARSVRIVLAELSERLSQALKDEDELKKALSTLMKKNGG